MLQGIYSDVRRRVDEGRVSSDEVLTDAHSGHFDIAYVMKFEKYRVEM